MSQVSSAPNAGILDRVVEAALESPRLTLGVWVLVLGLAIGGMLRLHVETSTDSVLSRQDPAWHYYQEISDRFGGDEIVVIAIEGATPFDPAALRKVAELTATMEATAGVRRVDSIATVPVVYVDANGTLLLDPALSRDPPTDDAAAAQVRERLVGDRIAPRMLISDDGRVFSVTVIMDQLGAEHDERIVNAVREAVGDSQAWISGGPVFRTDTNLRIQREVLLFVPVTIVLIGLVLFVALRSAAAAAIALLVGGVGTIVVVGAMGWAAVPLTISTMILPSLLLALGCAYSTHVLAARATLTGSASSRSAVLGLVRPIALSGLTTAVGFVAMSFVRIDVIRHIGGFGALGTLTVVMAALTIGPVLLDWMEHVPRRSRVAAWLSNSCAPMVHSQIRRRRAWIVAAWVLVAGGVGVGLVRLDVETDVVLWFSEGDRVRDDYEAIRERLSGISPMNVVIESEGDVRVTEVGALAAIDALAAYLEGLPEVGRTISIADPLRQINGGFLDDPAQPLPASLPAAEQYLLLLESVEQIHDLIAQDRESANVLLRVDDNGSDNLLDVARKAEQWWRDNGVPGLTAHTTGIMHEYARSENEIEDGQIRGLVFAISTIAVILLLVLRSVPLATLALLPNVVPLVFIFGLMGLLQVPVDAGTVLLGSLALGIAVDDTIHVVTAFQDARRRGLDSSGALLAALQRTLPALTLSTGAILVGFMVLGLSGFSFTRNLGLLTATVMVVCYLADILLLPALLMRRDARAAEVGGR